jgi:Holliday junction resolvase RusA-like endonuclease
MIRIEYPALPPKEYSPNSRVHWRKRSVRGAIVKMDVALLVMEAGGDFNRPFNRATVKIMFGLPDKRRRDLDNLIAASKPILDALPLADDNVRQVTVEYSWFESPRNPRTVIEIHEE